MYLEHQSTDEPQESAESLSSYGVLPVGDLLPWHVQHSADEHLSKGITMGAAISTMVLWFRSIFPVELIWLEAVPQLIGGGNPVAIGLLLSVIADATNEEERQVNTSSPARLSLLPLRSC